MNCLMGTTLDLSIAIKDSELLFWSQGQQEDQSSTAYKRFFGSESSGRVRAAMPLQATASDPAKHACKYTCGMAIPGAHVFNPLGNLIIIPQDDDNKYHLSITSKELF